MKIKTLIVVLVTIVLSACSPKITTNLTNKQPALRAEEKIALLDVHHNLPEGTTKIGDLRFQDSGFSTDCSFNSLMNRARIQARENGANIVKVVEKKAPDLLSSCYRLKIELYKYDGDVSRIPQYQLTLD
ncbi:hypothetical protein [Draconibacterium sediminis]|uniref:hypothetical protein n=1 Tax=Draconibacterium sediminis TaxID=1544798 RepID=UPI0026EF13C1|nr:hypothetical protein [Draconibacterium sediminis]